MRQAGESLIEIVSAYGRDGQYFGAVRLERQGQAATFEFGVTQPGYYALKRILDSNPFDALPGVGRRFFFGGSYTMAPKGTETLAFQIHVEQGAASKSLEFKGPRSLLENLLWFQSIASLDAASGLERLDSGRSS